MTLGGHSMGTPTQRARRKSRRSDTRRRLTNVQVDEVSLVDAPAVGEAVFCVAKRLTEEEAMRLEKDQATGDGEVVDETPAAEDVEKTAADEATDVGSNEPEQEAIAKDGEPAAGDNDAGEREPVEKGARRVAKAFATAISALRKVADELDSAGLYQLANLIEFSKYAFADDKPVADEVGKCESLPIGLAAELQSSTVERLATELAKRLNLTVLDPVEKEDDGDGIEKADATEPELVEGAEGSELEPVEKSEPEPEPISMLAQAAQIYRKRQADRARVQRDQVETEAMQRINKIAAMLEENLGRATSLGKRLDQATGVTS